jgi:flagellar biogenesis protein FliO
MRQKLFFIILSCAILNGETPAPLSINPVIEEEAVVAQATKPLAPVETQKSTESEKEGPEPDNVAIKEQNKNFQNAILKTFLSIVGLITLILFTIWLLRRISNNRHTFGMKSHSLQILEKRLLSPKTTMYLMEIDGKKVVFAESMLDVKVLYTETTLPVSTAPVPYTEFK